MTDKDGEGGNEKNNAGTADFYGKCDYLCKFKT